MRKAAIKGQVFICAVLSFVGLVNHGVWIWMAGRTGQKKHRLAGIIFLILCLGSVMIAGSAKNEKIVGVMTVVVLVSVFAPVIGIFMSLNAFKSCQSLRSLIREHQIRVDMLAEDDFADVQIYPDELTLKSSQRLFGNKGVAVLRAIYYKEQESRERKASQKRKAERAKEEARRLETERAKAESMRQEVERAKAEAERMRAETELKRPEMVDINSCTEQELSLVPGIGIILAKKAVQIRNEQGVFDSVDEFIREVGVRENNQADVKQRLVCTRPIPYTRGDVKKHGRKIDL